MAKTTPTAKFTRAFGKCDVQDRVLEALKLFHSNPRHPSLHFEKLKGTGSYRTIRVDRGRWRIVLRDRGHDEYDLVDMGRHDYVDRNYG